MTVVELFVLVLVIPSIASFHSTLSLWHTSSCNCLCSMVPDNKTFDEKVVLLVGSCGLDRLLSVSIFPNADAKVRTTAYNEIGGGNAANTASTMALLKDASFLSTSNLKIKVLTKLGDDYVGKQLAQELEESGVDISSPLFQYAGKGTTTAFTTIIVSDSEFTRTCIHTPGTCGELTEEDVNKVNMDEIFANVIHLHSDCRHTDASLALAIEARKRGITVSVDAEKDRNIQSQHALLELATTLFTNSTQLQGYFERRTGELETMSKRLALPGAIAQWDTIVQNPIVAETLAQSVNPSSFYLRWFGESQLEKDVVITKGSMGALRIKPTSIITDSSETGGNVIGITSKSDDRKVICIEHCHSLAPDDGSTKSCFTLQTAGVLKDAKIVDTTGAGDAFIGGYLLTILACGENSGPQLALNFGSWVGGKKLGGPGARSALPRAAEVDKLLGLTQAGVEDSLSEGLGLFGENI